MDAPIWHHLIMEKRTARKDVLMATAPMVQCRNDGVRRFAREAGWNLIDLSRLVGGTAGLGGWRGDGALVTLRNDSETVLFAKRLRRAGVPVVDISNQRPEIRIPRVCLDNIAVGRMAAEHFAERNYRNAAWFSTYWTNIQMERFAGFEEAWRSGGADSKPGPRRWILCESIPASRQNDQRAVARWFEKILRAAPKPLALLCHCGEDASRVLAECRMLGIAVPEDIAILSAGDYVGLCGVQSTPISSVGIAGERHGYEAAALLQRLMDGEPPPRSPILISPDPISVRASTDHTASADPLVARALALIDINLGRTWGVAQLASELGVQVLKLERHFRDDLGRTPGDEILRRRIAMAQKLLRETDLALNAIATRCGFCHASYLSNRFRWATGLSPSLWRSRART